MSSPTAWEYRIHTVDLDERNGITTLVHDLNHMGPLGWELASTTVIPESPFNPPGLASIMFVYKRPIPHSD
jgi:hypothetical protein